MHSFREQRPIASFDLQRFIAETGVGRALATYRKNAIIFSQGDPADSIFYILKGVITITVISEYGKEAVIGTLSAKDFFGQECLAGQTYRVTAATASTDCSLSKIPRKEMVQAIRDQSAFSEFFISFLLRRAIRVESDLVDQMFNSSEKRLARILLLLANYGQDGQATSPIPKVSQETLAKMIGTTRSRVGFFLKRFRAMKFIEDDHKLLRVNNSLLNVFLHERETSGLTA